MVEELFWTRIVPWFTRGASIVAPLSVVLT